MGPKFFQTIMGRSFFDHQMPRLVDALEMLAIELKRYNDNCEKQARDKKQDDKSV